MLVGVDEYEDDNISRLKGAGNDARALKNALVRHAGFPDDQVMVLASGEPNERRPTRANILQRLSNMMRLVPKDGLFLFSFSGHGMERQNRAFLLPSDARLASDAGFLEEVSISVPRIRDRIKESGVRQILVLLDACRNDPGGRATAPNPMSPAYTFRFDVRNREVEAFATVYATKVGDRAWEDNERKRGYFSAAIEEALSGRAANANGEVTLGALVEYLQQRVPKQVALDGEGRRQLPFSEVGGYKADQLVLSVVKTSEVRARDGCSEAAREGWDLVKDSGSKTLLERYAARFESCEYASLARLKAEAISPVPVPSPKVDRPKPQPYVAKDGLRYVPIPAGEFTMGCSPGDKECDADESPAHPVKISKPFWMSQTEVTVDAYRRFASAMPEAPRFNAKWQFGNQPIVNVSWDDAKRYCEWVGGRLPTEAEWEYAARAGTTGTAYGSVQDIGWFENNASNQAQAVGQKQPNAVGLYDMLGNVWEWTADWYDEKHYAARGADSVGPPSGKFRVVRGGSWYYNAALLRASNRDWNLPSVTASYLGFRCVWENAVP